ncbi:hypothetical protein ACFORO_21595 [Amycolatopsis halotolerans]|uniref:Uncharacterized protein n=1 Tax=Amycolatopsis halotolerans TaxID=330083 RepID=A0ABV7QHR7_9PSEU
MDGLKDAEFVAAEAGLLDDAFQLAQARGAVRRLARQPHADR